MWVKPHLPLSDCRRSGHMSIFITGVGIALPAVSPSRRAAILAAVDSLASQLSASSPVLALVLSFRLSLIARPQNFYPVEGAESAFLDEGRAAAWLEVSICQACFWHCRSLELIVICCQAKLLYHEGSTGALGKPECCCTDCGVLEIR